ncbi:MAG TPA: porin [Chitinophagales bacterium]|nr:porin [Chitinophagales bacterium]
MKHSATKVFTLLILIVWLGNVAYAGDKPASANSTYSLPVDSPKKEQAAPAPAPQMLTYPISSITAKMTLNGYTQVRFQDFEDGDPKTRNSFDIRNARLILRGTVLKNISYNFQCDFAPPTVRLMDGTFAYTINKFAKFTAGQQKVPLSYESLRTDYDIHSMSRSQVVEALTARSKDVVATAASTTAVNNNGRDIGLLFSGGVPNQKTQSTWVDYYLGVFDGMGINVTDKDESKDIGGRVVAHPIKNLSIGGSYYDGSATYGIDLSKPKNRNRMGFDIAYEDGKRIYAAAEYLQGTDSTTDRAGYYILAEGFFLPKKFSALVKYDFYDPNKSNNSDGTNNDATIVYSFALNWYFAQFTKVQVQYDFKHEDGAQAIQKHNDLFSIQAQVFF